MIYLSITIACGLYRLICTVTKIISSYLINIVKINTLFFCVFECSALLSVALGSRCDLSSVSPTLDRHLLTAQRLPGLHPCSSVRANVTVLLSPVLKVSAPWASLESLTHLYCAQHLKGYTRPVSLFQAFMKAAMCAFL